MVTCAENTACGGSKRKRSISSSSVIACSIRRGAAVAEDFHGATQFGVVLVHLALVERPKDVPGHRMNDGLVRPYCGDRGARPVALDAEFDQVLVPHGQLPLRLRQFSAYRSQSVG